MKEKVVEQKVMPPPRANLAPPRPRPRMPGGPPRPRAPRQFQTVKPPQNQPKAQDPILAKEEVKVDQQQVDKIEESKE